MEKSSTHPKEILKQRVAENILIKIPRLEENVLNGKNRNPILMRSTPNKKNKIFDRKLQHEDTRNPFHLPNNVRIFELKTNIRKSKSKSYVVSEPHTICDIDNTFYKVIEGRPLRQFTDIKVYMRNIRDITLFKANAAYLKDQIIQIETSYADEAKEYNKIQTLFVNSKINFAHFVKESYNKAKVLQAKVEDISVKLIKKMEQLEAYSFEFVKLRNQLCSKTASFETLTLYRKFLNSISPIEWRTRYDSFIDCNTLFPKTEEDDDITSTSDVSLNIFKTSIAKLQRTEKRLFFTEPIELMNILNNIRKQSLNYMEIEVFSNSILTSVLNSKDYLKANITTEFNELESLIDIYTSHIIWIEKRETECKELFEKLVKDKIESLYTSYDITKLFTCIQYVNGRLFGSPEDPKDNITILLINIESLYIELTSALDRLNQDIVKEATRELFTKDIEMMKRARTAQRAIKECDILNKALYTSFEPSRSIRK